MTAARSAASSGASWAEQWTEEERIIARCRRAISALRCEPEIYASMVARKAMLRRGPHDDATLAVYREFAAKELARRFGGWSGAA